jgi:hypothetical protein
MGHRWVRTSARRMTEGSNAHNMVAGVCTADASLLLDSWLLKRLTASDNASGSVGGMRPGMRRGTAAPRSTSRCTAAADAERSATAVTVFGGLVGSLVGPGLPRPLRACLPLATKAALSIPVRALRGTSERRGMKHAGRGEAGNSKQGKHTVSRLVGERSRGSWRSFSLGWLQLRPLDLHQMLVRQAGT